jgi:hypothetical protein
MALISIAIILARFFRKKVLNPKSSMKRVISKKLTRAALHPTTRNFMILSLYFIGLTSLWIVKKSNVPK